MSEEIKASKFKLLGISEKDFDALSIEDRISRLTDLKEEKQSDLNVELEDRDEYDARKNQLSELISETRSALFHYREAETRVFDLTTAYRRAVKAERSIIGKIGGYTRWYRVAEVRLDTARMRHYAIKIAVEREKLPSLKAEVARLREELRLLPSIWVIARKLDDLESALDIYEERLGDVTTYKNYIDRRITSIDSLIEEIERELKELKVKPKIVTHRYREVSFGITSHIEYESERRGREAGHDIDIEIQSDFRIKSLLPTRYAENEAGWLDELQEMVKNEMCKVIRECSNEYLLMPWEQIDAQGGWTCNIVGRRIVKRTIVNTNKFYKDLVPPIPKIVLMSSLQRELERYSFISVASVSVTRANELRQAKDRCLRGEQDIRPCVEKRSVDVIEEVVSWDISQEIDELMRYLLE